MAYDGWKVERLKLELAKRGAVLRGRKADLIERLEAYDRNHNFRDNVAFLPRPPALPNWPVGIFGFRQLTLDHKNQLPTLGMAQVEGYFLYRMAADNQCQSDIQAISKGSLLMESGRVEACSFKANGHDVFLTGTVAAAMKKKVHQ
ncbi:uncharacterized protein LOC117345032 isoform X2 [Pecten maximus]|uniref:uncharacterized protein LOC117339600 n=1 Tax=Pecten maximus TaxID=6579 RepID=UPI0014590780|nr:uncharacterized protein LOC117315615 isoform X2 [Pecten maximus]XP_033739380.1 uncharacterized protein LOC117326767 isoform X2 [Pecten maximus]XP_033757182.1 uncharacterized protein LOC117339600 [Pecten maximus]XP_033763852.1 uncharacterized protein LOC117345032 isoform X2 [Pecten maximus]